MDRNRIFSSMIDFIVNNRENNGDPMQLYNDWVISGGIDARLLNGSGQDKDAAKEQAVYEREMNQLYRKFSEFYKMEDDLLIAARIIGG